MRLARLMGVSWLFHVKALSASSFFLLTAILQPIIFASIAFFMFESRRREARCSTSRSGRD